MSSFSSERWLAFRWPVKRAPMASVNIHALNFTRAYTPCRSELFRQTDNYIRLLVSALLTLIFARVSNAPFQP